MSIAIGLLAKGRMGDAHSGKAGSGGLLDEGKLFEARLPCCLVEHEEMQEIKSYNGPDGTPDRRHGQREADLREQGLRVSIEGEIGTRTKRRLEEG